MDLFKIQVCVKDNDVGSIMDMLRYDDVKVSSVKHENGNVCVEGESRGFTEKRWESFGVKPKLVEKLRVKERKFKKFSQDEGEICVMIPDDWKDNSHDIKLLNLLKNTGIGFGNIRPEHIDGKMFICLGVRGERSDVVEFLDTIKDSEVKIKRGERLKW